MLCVKESRDFRAFIKHFVSPCLLWLSVVSVTGIGKTDPKEIKGSKHTVFSEPDESTKG